jgi:hypothetical protein
MNKTLLIFALWFWISLALGAVTAILLFVATRRRSIWLRYTAAEAAFWLRLGFPPRNFVEAARRFEEGRGIIFALWILLIAFLALAAVAGGAFLNNKGVTLTTKL